MDDKGMAHWHGPVYITTTFNERTHGSPPPLFFLDQPTTHIHTHRLLFWNKDTSNNSIYEGDESISFPTFWRWDRERKSRPTFPYHYWHLFGRAPFFHFSSLWAFFSLKTLTLLFILPLDPGWGAISNLGLSR